MTLARTNALSDFLFDTPSCHVVLGTSMLPALCHREKVPLIRHTNLFPGKCYAFVLNGTVIVHRLIALSKNQCLFSGDNTRRFENVPRTDIVAQVDMRESFIYIWILVHLKYLHALFLTFVKNKNPLF